MVFVQACIEACRNVGRTVGTLPSFFKSDRALSVDPCTREETIEEEMPAKSAIDGADSCSQLLTPRRQRLDLLRSQCSNEFEYTIKSSTEHWTEVPRKSVGDPILLSANSERFKELMEQWRCPKSEHGFFLHYGKRLKMGRKIAEGGQAEIFNASFKGDKRAFVLKVFKDARLEDLERLWPPPLLPLLYVDYEPDWMREERHCCWIRGGTVLKDGRFAFLMDKYSGDLRSLINRRMRNQRSEMGPFDLLRALEIMRDIARGMRSLHQRGIFHRDLKASNVLLREAAGSCVVADFETSMGVLGTGFWRAPEVLLALKTHTFDSDVWTAKADVYSFAMTCYEVITGHLPFEGLRQNDYDFVLNGGRPSVPRWYETDSRVFGFPNVEKIFWDPNPSVTKRRYSLISVPWLDNLLETCWDADPFKRPSFEDIVKTFWIRGYSSELFEDIVQTLPLRSPLHFARDTDIEGSYCNTDLYTIG